MKDRHAFLDSFDGHMHCSRCNRLPGDRRHFNSEELLRINAKARQLAARPRGNPDGATTCSCGAVMTAEEADRNGSTCDRCRYQLLEAGETDQQTVFVRGLPQPLPAILADRATLHAALLRLVLCVMAMDLEDQQSRPTEEDYQATLAHARAVLKG